MLSVCRQKIMAAIMTAHAVIGTEWVTGQVAKARNAKAAIDPTEEYPEMQRKRI